MTVAAPKSPSDTFAFSSSVAADVWHPQKDTKAYEWWYFDALSDDGKEAVVIVFLDNFVYSPRYNRSEPPASTSGVAHGAELRSISKGADAIRPEPFQTFNNEESVPTAGTGGPDKYPAVSFTYFRDGKPVYRAINEYPGSAFTASETSPECTIGDCSFRFQSASYGSGYLVTISAALSRDRRLEASLEWLSIESDFSPQAFCYKESAHCWNMVAPRSDVSGKISLFDRKGNAAESVNFRGSGYHDHNLDNRWLAKTVRDWHWGRAHFTDATAVFYRYCEIGDHNPNTKLFVVQDGELHERNVEYEEQNYVRDKYGIRYPTRLRLISEDDFRLNVKPLKIIDSSFYYLRFLSEITLTMPGGKQSTTTGITEFLAPKALKHRWLNWISDIRIGKNGKGPFIS
ncbi:MAG: hypothetical protein H7070_10885 [Saprospiraceae bacterium]|nr:hypothetical protein [Pyrinomonadaceae bacterium]